MAERFALYFAPAADNPLTTLANGWLGRDPLTGESPVGPAGIDASMLANSTKQARVYGFHATLKAPIRLADGHFRADFEQAVSDFVKTESRVALGPLKIARLGAFMALIPMQQSTEVTDFAATCVTFFDRFRAPAGAEERARRLASGLSPRQQELLEQYGYPYVLEEFRFHMTLTDKVHGETAEALWNAAHDWFAPVLAEPVWLDRVVLFHQPEAGAPFRRLADYKLAN